MDGRISFLSSIISKSSRMLGFIKRFSREFRDPYTHKTLYTSLVKPNLEHALCVSAFGRLISRLILSGLSACNTISFVMRCVDYRRECGLCQRL
jgi:hypothetical protein